MRTKSIRAILLVLISSVSLLVSCGGGGGGRGTSPPASGEGSWQSPLYLGTVSTSLTHSGSVGADSTSFYRFTTGSISGPYTISLTNTHSDLSWAFADPGFNAPTMVCDNFWSPGASDEICSSFELGSFTNYYLAVDEWDTVAGTYTLTISPPPPFQTPPLAYNFDNGTFQGWTTNGFWNVTNNDSHSGSYSVAASPPGNAPYNMITWLDSPLIDLTATTAPKLTFWHRYNILLSGYNEGRVEVSTNDGLSWANITPSGFYNGTLSTFTLVTIDLTPYKSSSQVVIRFLLNTDGIYYNQGWYIDDIGISVN